MVYRCVGFRLGFMRFWAFRYILEGCFFRTPSDTNNNNGLVNGRFFPNSSFFSPKSFQKLNFMAHIRMLNFKITLDLPT